MHRQCIDDSRGGIFCVRNHWTMIDRAEKTPSFRRRVSSRQRGRHYYPHPAATYTGEIFLFARARIKHSPSFARKLHAPFSDARRALSPCVESGMDAVFADGIIV